MLGLGMLGNEKKPSTVIVGTGMMKDKMYNEKYGDEEYEDELDMFNPVEMMMEEFINSVHEKDSRKASQILCSIIKIERMKGKTEIEIKA